MLATLQASDFYFTFSTENRFLEGEDYILFEVVAPLGLLGPAAGNVAEERVEYVPKPAENVETVEGAIEPAI